MFATILFAAMPFTLQSQNATQVAVERVRSSIQREYCKTYFELRDREVNRKKGVATGPENDLAIERLRNRKAQLQHKLESLSDHD
jgi:hypothetical protein